MNVIAARLFARCIESSHAPFIAVLGPPGSGKTPLLRVVYRKLQARKDILPMFVNMRRLSLGSELQMEAQLASLLVKEIEGAHVADIASLQLRQTATLSQLLEDICRHCHRRVLVFFDQFDSVPHYFSRAVSRQI